MIQYGDGVLVQVTPMKRTLASSNPNAPAAISKGMRAVKLCSNKILQFLTGCLLTQVVLYNGRKTVVVEYLNRVAYQVNTYS